MMRRLAIVAVVITASVAIIATTTTHSLAAPTASPLSVTPYSGFNPSLTRAPYVTDLTQTSAYVNWATNSESPGSLQVSPIGTGGCPASTMTWSTSANPLPVPTQIPYQASGSTATTTSWEFTVVNGAGTTINEYQASVLVKNLSPGTTYCYAVFSTDKAGATDLLPPSTSPSLQPLPVQSFTTLLSPSASSTAPVKFDVIDDTGENYEDTTEAGGSSDVPFNSTGSPINPDEASLYEQIGISGAQFLIDAGDTGYNDGSQTNLGDLEQTGTTTDVSNFFGPSYDPLAGGIPTFVASGDHNQNNTGLKVWPTPTSAADSGGTYGYDSVTDVDGITGSAPADWYAFSTGNVRVYVIDGAWGESATGGKLGTTTGSLCGTPGSSAADACQPYEADNVEHWQTSSAEYQWLASDLANPAYSGMVKFAVFHFPLRSDNESQPSDLYAQNSSANPNASTSLEALLSGYGVDIAFNGHAHTYDRTIPSGPGQVINYVSGGGGGVLEPVQGSSTTTCKSLLAASSTYAIGWSPSTSTGSSCGTSDTPTSIAQVYNFLQVSVSGDHVTVSPTNAAGQTFDVQTYKFGSSSGSTPTIPGNVTATATSSSSVRVNWTASTETGGTIKSYDVDRDGAQIGTVNAPATAYTDTSVQPSTTYTYSVIAMDESGHSSGPGTSRPVTTPPLQVTTPPTSTLPPSKLPFSGPPAQTDCSADLPAGSVVGSAALGEGSGYYEVDSAGDVAAFGGAVCYGAMTGIPLNQPIVGIAVDPATGGYWLVATDGGIFSFNAPFLGSTGGIVLNKPIVGMAADRSSGGYWLVASDGGIFAFGAPFYGSTGNLVLNKPVVGMALDPATGGYWLVASDGGIFAFGAPFYGSTGNLVLNKPVVGIAPAPDGSGYRLVAADGGIFSFNAPFYGSTGSLVLNAPVVAAMTDERTGGYWLVATDGGIFSFNAPFFGSAVG